MRRKSAIVWNVFAEENSAYCVLLGRSKRTMMTNFGFFDGPYPAYEVFVRPFSPFSNHPLLLAICDVPVLPAREYPATHPAFANHTRADSVSIAVIF